MMASLSILQGPGLFRKIYVKSMLVNNEFLNWFRDAWQLFFQQYKGYLKTAVNYTHKKLVVILEVDIANDLLLIQYQPCTTVVLLGRT